MLLTSYLHGLVGKVESVGSQGRIFSSMAETSSTFVVSWFILTLLARKCSGLVFRIDTG